MSFAGGAVNATQLASACAPRSGLETLHLADAGTSDEDEDECGARRAAKAPREEGAFHFACSLPALASAHPRTPRTAPLRSPGTPPSKTPWLEPTSISFPFTADGGRRAVEACYVARLPCCPYTALDALHFRCGSVYPHACYALLCPDTCHRVHSTYTRQLLVDFIVAVSTRWRFEEDTLHLALRLIDDYLRTKRGGADAFLCWMLNEAAHAGAAPLPAQRPRPQRASRLSTAAVCALMAKAAGAVIPASKKEKQAAPDASRASIGSVGAAPHLVLAPCAALVMPPLCDCLPATHGSDALRHSQLLCPTLRCLAVTVLHLAAKHNERMSRLPGAAEMAASSEVGLFSARCMSRLEALVLTALAFTTLRPIPTSFASAYLAMMPALHADVDTEYPLGSALEMSTAYLLDISLYATDTLAWPPSMVAAACVSLALRMAAWSMFQQANAGRMPHGAHDAAQGRIRSHASVLFSATGYGSRSLLPVLTALQRAVSDAHAVTEAGGMRGLLTRYTPALVRDYAAMAEGLMQATPAVMR